MGVGDFTGDGTDDILFRDNATGDTGLHEMSNGVNIGWHDIGAYGLSRCELRRAARRGRVCPLFGADRKWRFGTVKTESGTVIAIPPAHIENPEISP